MTELGRLQPFVAVTQSNPFAMPAKGSLRPGTALRWDLNQGPLVDQKAAVWKTLLKPPVLTPSRYILKTTIRMDRTGLRFQKGQKIDVAQRLSMQFMNCL